MISVAAFAHHPRFPSLMVSDDGRIFRHGSMVRPRHNPTTGRPYINHRGERIYLHHAVLETFVGPRPEGYHALHANDDPDDNRLSNLRWGTLAENMADRRVNNPDWSHGGPKMTPDQVVQARREHPAVSINALARRYGVAHSTMRKAIRGETWKDLP